MSLFTHISTALNSENQSADSLQSTGSTQAESMNTAHDNDLTAFFAIGMVINILLVGTFIIWGFKQWKRK